MSEQQSGSGTEHETIQGESPAKKAFIARALDRIERVGNALPDPLTLFLGFAALVALASFIAAKAGVSVVHPGTKETIAAVNLLSAEGIRRMLTEAVSNFATFPPLGTVLVAMIGIGVAERSGLITTGLKLLVRAVPKRALAPTVVFAGVMSSMAADAGYVVLTPLGAVVFAGIGRHPIAGLAAAFAGVSGGFSANLLLTSLDPLLAGLTETAARMVEPSYSVAPTANYYFMILSVFLVTVVGWFVTDRLVEPRLGPWRPSTDDGADADGADALAPPTAREKRALVLATLAFVLVLGLAALLVVPEGAVLRADDGGLGPFYGSIVPLLAIAFFVPGVVYGAVAGTIGSDKAVAKMTADTLATLGSYIALAFAAAQFVAYFTWSKLGIIFAVKGATLLESLGVSGVVLLLGFVVVSAFINLFIGSASAKWAIMAPVFVPMLMLMGYSPEVVQAAYRVGDSVTNIITPLLPYFPIVIAFAQRYDKRVGLGTLISAMLPYSVAFLCAWTVMFLAWVAFGIPLGPDAPLLYERAAP